MALPVRNPPARICEILLPLEARGSFHESRALTWFPERRPHRPRCIMTVRTVLAAYAHGTKMERAFRRLKYCARPAYAKLLSDTLYYRLCAYPTEHRRCGNCRAVRVLELRVASPLCFITIRDPETASARLSMPFPPSTSSMLDATRTTVSLVLLRSLVKVKDNTLVSVITVSQFYCRAIDLLGRNWEAPTAVLFNRVGCSQFLFTKRLKMINQFLSWK